MLCLATRDRRLVRNTVRGRQQRTWIGRGSIPAVQWNRSHSAKSHVKGEDRRVMGQWSDVIGLPWAYGYPFCGFTPHRSWQPSVMPGFGPAGTAHAPAKVGTEAYDRTSDIQGKQIRAKSKENPIWVDHGFTKRLELGQRCDLLMILLALVLYNAG